MQLQTRARELIERLRSRSTASSVAERDPVVRRMDFPFAAADIPRHWLGGSVTGTAIANALNLVFPDGERFFIRSVNHYLDEIDDPKLRERVRRFYGQEGQHAREHERLYDIMREQGLDIDTFLASYRHLAYEVLAPRVPAKLRLSITVALEHFTASFAEFALRRRILTDLAPPVMADLLLWHAAEEIEHKAVAFDVLAAVDDSYAVRIAGLVAATIALMGFWGYGIAMLLRQETDVGMREILGEWVGIKTSRGTPSEVLPGAFLDYLRPGFHPSQVQNDELAAAYLESIGRRVV